MLLTREQLLEASTPQEILSQVLDHQAVRIDKWMDQG